MLAEHLNLSAAGLLVCFGLFAAGLVISLAVKAGLLCVAAVLVSLSSLVNLALVAHEVDQPLGGVDSSKHYIVVILVWGYIYLGFWTGSEEVIEML